MRFGEASAVDGKRKVWLAADKVWVCHKCKTHLAAHHDIKLRRYRGYYGPAYLFKKVVNVKLLDDDRRMIPNEVGGFDTVVEVRCMDCGTEIGQKFLSVPKDVKFKQNKVLLERRRIAKDWE